MPDSPFPPDDTPRADNSPADDSPRTRVRQLQSPAQRFGTAETRGADAEADGVASEASAEASADEAAPAGAESGAEDLLEAGAAAGADVSQPDPFEALPRAKVEPSVARATDRPRARGGRAATTQRTRRQTRAHEPHYHQKKPYTVAHNAVNPAPASEPLDDWDRAAQNSMARALLARRRARVRRIVARVAIAAGTLFAVWAGAMALTAPQFEISRVEVNGLQSTPAPQVRALTDKLVGQNVFRAPRASVERGVAAITTVASARLSRAWTWPPQMRLSVVERRPILRVGAGQTWWVADASGVAFRRASARDAGLYALTSPQLQPATGRALPGAAWKRAVELQAALAADNTLAAGAEADNYWDLRRVYLDEEGAAALRVGEAGALKRHAEMLVRLGEDEWPQKLVQARRAIAYLDRTGSRASELDLVSSEHPRWRPLATPKALPAP